MKFRRITHSNYAWIVTHNYIVILRIIMHCAKSIDILNIGIIGIWPYWSIGILAYWTIGRLGYWNIGMLKYHRVLSLVPAYEVCVCKWAGAPCTHSTFIEMAPGPVCVAGTMERSDI